METDKKSNGIGLGTILCLIFLTLKLAKLGPVQYWSWWWIFSPIWIPSVVLVILLFILFLFKNK